ncbi:MAG: hypothetical protein ACR2GR_11950 [Rhodothermales bacterium]
MHIHWYALIFAPLLFGTACVVQAQTSEIEAPTAYAGILSRSDSLAGRPPSASTKRKAGQVAAGALAGAGAGLAGGFIGAALSSCGNGDFLCGLEGAALGILLGEVIGSTAGVYLAGRTAETTSSIGFTLLGSVAGLSASILLASAVSSSDYFVVPVLLLGAPVGATLAYNLRRRYRNPSQQSGLLNLDRSGFYVGVPVVERVRLADPLRTSARSVRLLTASW